MNYPMAAIKNKEILIENGETSSNRKARMLALSSLEYALKAVDPKQIIRSKILLKNSKLLVDSYTFKLNNFKNIYVVGGGKASGSMAEALEQILGSRIKDGIVNVPYGYTQKTEIIRLHEASHPIPDKAGVEGTQGIIDLVETAKENDLVICLISGGGSSLMPLPREGISLADKKKITDMLLKSGATINEINTVRKHISNIKGGWLAKRTYPATILNLILSDVIGDPLEFIASGPTVPDSTTFKDAKRVLKKYSLWEKAPASIRKVLSDGDKGLISETPKPDDAIFRKVFNVVVGNNRTASLAAYNYLKSQGLNTLLLTTTLEGEARHVGVMMASIIQEIYVSKNPLRNPAAIVAGGETTVTVIGNGIGGRNQELALAAIPKIKGINGAVLAAMSTDGVDGPTDAAGAIIDGKSLERASKRGLVSEEYLAENDSYNFFLKMEDLIFTGQTGTNVNDVCVMVVL
jgi:glycerate-2-kinase